MSKLTESYVSPLALVSDDDESIQNPYVTILATMLELAHQNFLQWFTVLHYIVNIIHYIHYNSEPIS